MLQPYIMAFLKTILPYIMAFLKTILQPYSMAFLHQRNRQDTFTKWSVMVRSCSILLAYHPNCLNHFAKVEGGSDVDLLPNKTHKNRNKDKIDCPKIHLKVPVFCDTTITYN